MAGIIFDVILIFLLTVSLFTHFLNIITLPDFVFAVLSFIGLLPVLKSAISALIKRKLTIDLLASIALIFALASHEWYSAAFINLMLAFARIFASWVEMRSKNIIARLLKFRPEKVKVKRNGEEVIIPLNQVKVGDLIHVEMGERVPVDGKIINGKASINESTLTGESELKVKTVGDQVFESTLNESGFIEINAEKVGADSQFARVIALIENAAASKAVANRIADRFTFWYILATLCTAVILYFVTHNLTFILSVLLVICADDIAVAVPLGFTMAISTAAKRGVLIKGGDVVENLAKVSNFISDKTGTLTRGKPKVRQVELMSKISEGDFLQLLASISVDSQHPISQAIIKFCQEKNISPQEVENFSEIPGEGVTAKINGAKILVGRIAYLREQNVEVSSAELQKMEEIMNKGFGVVGLSMDKKIIGVLAIEDEIRKAAPVIIRETKRMGVKKWMILTGDNEKVAAKVAREVGADEYHANLKPVDKITFIREFKKKNNGILAMMGDGVNDAAALSMVDVSIAMGAIGSDAAIEASDVALMHDNLCRVPETMKIAKHAMQIIKQNFLIWGATNATGLILVFAGFLGPVGASAYNFITDFFPIINSLRIGWIKKTAG
jgi:Cd2+/Zn2+-exporting ATPase